MEVIDVKAAREYVMANYPNDPLLKHIAVSLLEQLPKVEAEEVCFRNGEQNMKEKVISMLMDHKTRVGLECHTHVVEIIKMVEAL